jgi:hypothetical protein
MRIAQGARHRDDYEALTGITGKRSSAGSRSELIAARSKDFEQRILIEAGESTTVQS